MAARTHDTVPCLVPPPRSKQREGVRAWSEPEVWGGMVIALWTHRSVCVVTGAGREGIALEWE